MFEFYSRYIKNQNFQTKDLHINLYKKKNCQMKKSDVTGDGWNIGVEWEIGVWY